MFNKSKININICFEGIIKKWKLNGEILILVVII